MLLENKGWLPRNDMRIQYFNPASKKSKAPPIIYMPSKHQNFLELSPIFSLSPFLPRENRIRKALYSSQLLQIATLPPKMKKSGLLAAYVAAASATAVSVSSPSSSSSLQALHQDATVQRNHENSSSASSSSADKFAPRFDGLRFIETLVTAHR